MLEDYMEGWPSQISLQLTLEPWTWSYKDGQPG